MSDTPTDPPDVHAAREALADFDAPRCGAYIESTMHDEDGPIPGCDCARHAGHDGDCYGAPDEPQWGRLRATLAHLDTLTTRLHAANARWLWTLAADRSSAILAHRSPGATGFAQVATALPRGDGMLSVRVNGQAHTAADDLAAALATIRAVLGADVPDFPTEDLK